MLAVICRGAGRVGGFLYQPVGAAGTPPCGSSRSGCGMPGPPGRTVGAAASGVVAFWGGAPVGSSSAVVTLPPTTLTPGLPPAGGAMPAAIPLRVLEEVRELGLLGLLPSLAFGMPMADWL